MAIYRIPEKLILTAQQWEEMRVEAERKKPDECCGLLAGTAKQNIYKTVRVFPTANILHSPTSYRLDPHEQLEVFNEMEERDWDLVGIYHSHPQGPEEPSPSDISEAYYPEAVYLIWCGRTGDWTCRGFLIQDKVVQEIPILIKKGDGLRNL